MLKRLIFFCILIFLLLGFIYYFFLYRNIFEHKSEAHRLNRAQIIVGFQGTSINDEQFKFTRQLIESGRIHGLIFFDRNIESKEQLYDFIQAIRSLRNGQEILLAIDEEGGMVSRLARTKGLTNIPTATDILKYTKHNSRQFFLQRAILLRWLGFDVNFAPVVDLAVNQDNKVIVGTKRSYSSSADIVTEYAEQFIRAHRSNGILTVIKHYPGHGSSFSDSHSEFTDITDTYYEEEERPFQQLIAKGLVDGVMTGHLFNRNVDPQYPASLSEKHVSDNLRGKLGFKGLVFTDDLQMGAIRNNYSLVEATRLAINSGADFVMFADFYLLSKEEQEEIFDGAGGGT